MRTESPVPGLEQGGAAATPQWFIYYRAQLDQLAAVVAAVQGFQQSLCATHPTLRAGLMRRPDVRDGLVTLMEIYQFHPSSSACNATEPSLPCPSTHWPPAILHAVKLTHDAIVGPRHVEVFVPCA